jgi:Skp family chaperone for outer membrane proteins
MNKNLTIKEEKTARNLKTEFTSVHSQIQGIQTEMEFLQKRAKELIEQLENLRAEESTFAKSLEEKYGEGKLNPFTLIYEQKEEENANN